LWLLVAAPPIIALPRLMNAIRKPIPNSAKRTQQRRTTAPMPIAAARAAAIGGPADLLP